MNPADRHRPISSDMLAAFLKVAESLSVSRAASDLDVGKGLVSKRIAQLEEKLETVLFARSTRKIALTPAGEAYLEFARRALNEITGGMERVRSLKSELTGTLRLTAPVSWGQRVLAKQLPEFLRLHPALRLELMLSDRLMDIAAERIDLALRWSNSSGHPLSQTPMATVQWLLTASPVYLSQHGLPITPQQLADHVCLYYRRDSSDDSWTLEAEPGQRGMTGETVHIKVSGRYSVDNPEAVREFALAGLGIALLPDYLYEEAIQLGTLVHVMPAWTPRTKFGTQIVALSTPERMRLLRTRALLDYLKGTLARDAHAPARAPERWSTAAR